MPKILVSDTNIWIAFHRAEALESVFQLPYQFVTTDFAFDELKIPAGADLLAMGLGVVSLTSDEVRQLFNLNAQWRKPSLPDISCYLYASQNTDHILLTGDADIRRKALETDVRTHGILWLLDKLGEHGVLTPKNAATTLEAMLAAGTFLPHDECERRLKCWKQAVAEI